MSEEEGVEFNEEIFEILCRPNITSTMQEVAREDAQENAQTEGEALGKIQQFQDYEDLPLDGRPSENPYINFQSEILRVPFAKHQFNEIARWAATYETKQKARNFVLDVSEQLFRVTHYRERSQDLEFMRNEFTILKEKFILSLPPEDITHALNLFIEQCEQLYFAALLSGYKGFERNASISQIVKKTIGIGGTTEEDNVPEPKRSRIRR